MICLAYLSSATTDMDSAELEDILAQSRRNNVRDGITGMLCHYDGSFLQFLEGEEAVVSAAFKRIGRDQRHAGVIEVYRQPIEARAFADWSMSLVKPDAVGEEHRAFCRGLRQIQIGGDAAHRPAIEPFLESFRAWIR